MILAYRGHLGSSWEEQQQALHQGSSWTWLLGPYVDAMLMQQNHFNNKTHASILSQEYLWHQGLLLLEPFNERFRKDCLV